MKSVHAPIIKVTRDFHITDLAYADDIVLLGENEEDAQRLLQEISTAAARLELIVSIPKTKAVFFNCTTPTISLNNTNIENVEVFTYLGSKINTSSCSDEVNTRIGKAQHAFSRLRKQVWERNEVSLTTKMRIYLFSLSCYTAVKPGPCWIKTLRDWKSTI